MEELAYEGIGLHQASETLWAVVYTIAGTDYKQVVKAVDAAQAVQKFLKWTETNTVATNGADPSLKFILIKQASKDPVIE